MEKSKIKFISLHYNYSTINGMLESITAEFEHENLKGNLLINTKAELTSDEIRKEIIKI